MRHVIAVVGLVGLAACSQPAATQSEQAAAGNSAAPKVVASGQWNAEDACALLDKATVGAALGTKIVKVELGPTAKMTDQSAGMSTCFYDLEDGQRLAFLARQSPMADNTPAAMKKARDEVVAMLGPVTEVTGVGKSAFWIPSLRQLVVFLGEDRYFNVTMPAKVGDKDPKTLALGLATRIE